MVRKGISSCRKSGRLRNQEGQAVAELNLVQHGLLKTGKLMHAGKNAYVVEMRRSNSQARGTGSHASASAV